MFSECLFDGTHFVGTPYDYGYSDFPSNLFIQVSDDLENKPGDSKVEGDILFKLIADDGEDNLEMRKLLVRNTYWEFFCMIKTLNMPALVDKEFIANKNLLSD